jgi:hypothetical protein
MKKKNTKNSYKQINASKVNLKMAYGLVVFTRAYGHNKS